jgi:hypothetical protein
MPPPPPWRFRCIASIVGAGSTAVLRDEVRAWHDRQSNEWRRKFAGRIFALNGMPFDEWKPLLFRWLRGDGQGLGEIRFKADSVQQRPLGFRGPEPDVFTIVFPSAQEKKSRFVPANAIKQAQRLRAEVEARREHTVDCWLFRDP